MLIDQLAPFNAGDSAGPADIKTFRQIVAKPVITRRHKVMLLIRQGLHSPILPSASTEAPRHQQALFLELPPFGWRGLNRQEIPNGSSLCVANPALAA